MHLKKSFFNLSWRIIFADAISCVSALEGLAPSGDKSKLTGNVLWHDCEVRGLFDHLGVIVLYPMFISLAV